jgi:hypothetical protein
LITEGLALSNSKVKIHPGGNRQILPARGKFSMKARPAAGTVLGRLSMAGRNFGDATKDEAG